MPELANLWVGVGADISDFQRKMGRVGKQTRDVGKKMGRVGSTLTKSVTLPVAAVGAGVVKMASDFQGAMNDVQAVTQPTTRELAAMEKMAKRLGRTTQFSASEAAQGMKFLGQAGLSASEQMQALPNMLDLAAAGSLDLGRAADIATDLTAGFGLEASEMGRVNDVLAQTASSATTDVAMMAETMKQVAPVAKSSGISLEETSAAAGVLANSGIKASQAGTQLRGVIAKMEAPTKQQKKVMDELGVSFTDAEGNTVGLIEAVRRMSEAGADTGDIMQIFGRRAGTAMSALVEQGAPAIREFEGELRNAQGRAKEMADTKMQGLPGMLKKLKSAFEGMALAIADAVVVDMFVAIAEKVRGVMQSVAKANPTLLKIGVILAGVGAAIGPLLIVLGAAVSAFGALMPVIAALAGPVGIVVAAIAGLTAALVTAYTKSERFRDIVNGAFDAVKNVVGPTIGWLGDRLKDVGDFFGITRTTVVDEVTEMSNKAVGDVVDMSQKMISEAIRLKTRVGDELSAEMADRWTRNVKKMADKAITEAERQHFDVVATMGDLQEDLSSITKDTAADVVANSRKQMEETVRMNRLAKERALRQIKELRESGVAVTSDMADRIIASFENQRDRAVMALADQEQQATNVLSRLEAESGKISVRMAAKAIQQSAKQRDKTVSAARQEFRDRVAAINEMESESETFTREMADEAIKEARRSRDVTIDNARSQHKGVVAEIKAMRDGVEEEVDLTTGNVLSTWDKFLNRIKENSGEGFSGLVIDTGKWLFKWGKKINEKLVELEGKFATWFSDTLDALGEWLSDMIGDVRSWMSDLVGWFGDLPDRIKGALGNLGGTLMAAGRELIEGLAGGISGAGDAVTKAVKNAFSDAWETAKSVFGAGTGDGPGFGIPSVTGGGGSAMSRAQSAMKGLPVQVTSTYRTPAENERVGGSPTSYHLDKSNPAVDIGGPTWALDVVAARLRAMNRNRELLWRTSGHFDHVHVAHDGGRVTRQGIDPLRGDEIMAKLQTGETVLPRDAGRMRGSGRSMPPLVVQIDSREVARVTAPEMEEQLARRERQGG